MGILKNKPPKKHYEVVAFDENGTTLYYNQSIYQFNNFN